MTISAGVSDRLTLVVMDQPAAFEELRTEWLELEDRAADDNIFLSWIWQHAWWAELGGNRPLAILAFRSAGRLVAVCPTYEDLLEGRPVVRFGGGLEVSDYLGLLVEPGLEGEVGRAFLEHFQARGLLLDFHFLRSDGVTLNALRAAASDLGWTAAEEVEEVSPHIHLAGDFEQYLQSLDKKDRHELRRKRRRLDEAGGWTVRQTSPETLDADLEEFFTLHHLSSRAKSDFMTDSMKSFFQHICGDLQEAGWLSLRTMVREGRAVAAVLGFTHRGRLLLYNSGYDPEYNRLSCGFVMMSEEIRLAIESGMTEVDFLRGNERYKYELGARDRDLVHLALTPGSPR